MELKPSRFGRANEKLNSAASAVFDSWFRIQFISTDSCNSMHIYEQLDDVDLSELVVRRCHILDYSLGGIDKAAFDPKKQLEVSLVGKESCDAVCPTRELFKLLKYIFEIYILITGTIKHDFLAVEVSRKGFIAFGDIDCNVSVTWRW
uniref:Uncharacterized protein n=1 Tax=Amphimedon queenslandica TaxID=400682 RepID=A0A1X7UK88_AMPQE